MKISNLYAHFKKSNFTLDVSTLELKAMKINCLIGDNGSGKSTLLKEIIKAKNSEFSKMMLLQKPYIFAGSVQDNIKMIKKLCPNSKIDEKQLIKDLALEELLAYESRSLSGGQKQRLSFALVMLSDYDLIILDEPFNNVDAKVQKAMIKIMQTYPKTYLLVSHKLNISKHIEVYFYFIDNGQIIFEGDREVFFKKENKKLEELMEMD